MSGRRRHPRYLWSNLEGVLRVVTDVTVQQDARGNLTAITDQPHIQGDLLTIELTHRDLATIPVRVLQTCPIVENGSIRHLLMLVCIEQEGRAAAPGDDSA